MVVKKGDKRDDRRGDKRGKKDLKHKKGGRHGKKGGNPKSKDPKATMDSLDKEMESYWVKGGHSDLAQQRLDDDLAGYFEKQEEAKEEAKNIEQ